MISYKTYRSLQTIDALQYTGDPIPEVTCSGVDDDYQKNGCDGTRKHLPHVHTRALGGLTVLKPGDWIMPEQGGPFDVASDEKFQANWEVKAKGK